MSIKAVTRFNFDAYHGCEFEADDGYWVRFTDHEQVMGELERLAYNVETENEFIRHALAASRAEVERQAKVIESYRLQKIEADKTIAYHQARRRNSHAS